MVKLPYHRFRMVKKVIYFYHMENYHINHTNLSYGANRWYSHRWWYDKIMIILIRDIWIAIFLKGLFFYMAVLLVKIWMEMEYDFTKMDNYSGGLHRKTLVWCGGMVKVGDMVQSLLYGDGGPVWYLRYFILGWDITLTQTGELVDKTERHWYDVVVW